MGGECLEGKFLEVMMCFWRRLLDWLHRYMLIKLYALICPVFWISIIPPKSFQKKERRQDHKGLLASVLW
jgi:hypothetical protein